MKNPNLACPKSPKNYVKASSAIERIHNWVEDRYPRLAAVAKSKLIIECLIEIAEEKKFIAAQ